MDITTLAAWGELIGGFGVIASLVYLGGQIRQNSRLLRASTATATAQIHSVPIGFVAQDPEIARIYWDGMEDYDSLSKLDRRRFEALLSILVQSLITRRDFALDGVVRPGAGEQTESTLRWLFTQPGGRGYWRTWRESYAAPIEATDVARCRSVAPCMAGSSSSLILARLLSTKTGTPRREGK